LSWIGNPASISWVAGSTDGIAGSSGKHDKAPNSGHVTFVPTRIKLLIRVSQSIPLSNQWQGYNWLLDTGIVTRPYWNPIDSNDLNVSYVVGVGWGADGSLHVNVGNWTDNTSIYYEDARDHPWKYFSGDTCSITIPLSWIGNPASISWVAGSTDGIAGSSGKHDKAPNSGHVTFTPTNVVTVSHDISVSQATLGKTILGENCLANISVTIENHGNYDKTVDVTAYADSDFISRSANLTLPSGNSTTITLIWDSSGFSKGNHAIVVHADTVPNEGHSENNDYIAGTAYLGILGDINGDGTVEMMDFYVLCNHYNHAPPDGHSPGSLEYHECLNADIYTTPWGDGVIEMMDFYVMAQNYGKSIP
jgi:hypothetical protein